MGTIEFLLGTRLQLIACTSGTQLKDVVGFGSGFMLSYKGYNFLITAAHVAEPNWNEKNVHPRLDSNDIAIATTLSEINESGIKQTVYIPVGGFEFVEQLHIDLNSLSQGEITFNGTPEPIDVTYTIVKDRPGVFHFNLEPKDSVSENDSRKCEYLVISENAIYPVDEYDHYFVYGRIKFERRIDEDGSPYWYSEDRFHVDMTYRTTINGNILVFETANDDEVVYEEWAGISGAPILNQEGGLVGIACSVLDGTHTMFGLDINFVLKFLDIAIDQEKRANDSLNCNVTE